MPNQVSSTWSVITVIYLGREPREWPYVRKTGQGIGKQSTKVRGEQGLVERGGKEGRTMGQLSTFVLLT